MREHSNNIVKSNKTIVITKDDGVNRLDITYYDEDRLASASIRRRIGDITQALGITWLSRNEVLKKPILRFEAYSNVIEHAPNFEPVDDNRLSMRREQNAPFCRPTTEFIFTLLDIVESPAFKLSALRKYTEDNVKYVQIDYTIDQIINDQQANIDRLWNLKAGSVTLRPDLAWVITKSVYVMESNKVDRKWQSDYSYDIKENGVPVIKSIKSKTIDGNPEKNLLPLNRSADYQLEIMNSKLSDEELSLRQFGMEERTPEAFQREMKLQKEAELKEQNTFAPTPPGGFPIASQPFTLSPWIILTSAAVLLLLIGLFLARKARKMPSS